MAAALDARLSPRLSIVAPCYNEEAGLEEFHRRISAAAQDIVCLLYTSIDAKQPCGSFGWAVNSHLGKAENASLRRCYEFGGHDCVVRAWACDEKG